MTPERKILYHGSPTKHTTLIPHQAYDTGFAEGCQNAVYATTEKAMAICFALGAKHDENGNVEREMMPEYGDKIIFKKGTPNYGQKGYIYVLDGSKFTHAMGTQWISTEEVAPLEIIEIEVNDYLYYAKVCQENTAFPTRNHAEALLKDAESCNPGPWGDHSRAVAYCAEKIAEACQKNGHSLDPKKAYVLGLLHDIGRKFGVKHFGHIFDGYTYMLELGYGAAAKICLTHSFCIKRIEDYIGNFDVTSEQQKVVEDALYQTEYDDYDLLIQLCDCIGTADGVSSMEERMGDVKRRYGKFPQDKWDKNMELKAYFDSKVGRDIYDIL